MEQIDTNNILIMIKIDYLEKNTLRSIFELIQ